MRGPYKKFDIGINEDIGEAIYNQIWKLHDDMHEGVLLNHAQSEEQRNNILEWNNKIFRKNAKRLKKEINDFIDSTTKIYSNMTTIFTSYKYDARPRSEKSFDEIEKDKRDQLLWKICAITSTVSSLLLLICLIIERM